MVTISDFFILQNNFGYGVAGGTGQGVEELARFAAALGLTGEADEGNANDQDPAPLDVLCPTAAIVLFALIAIGFFTLAKTGREFNI